MHIRAFVGAALLALGMLAFAPVAMADPAPNICVLDLSQPATADYGLDIAAPSCAAMAVDVASAVHIMGGDQDVAAWSCENSISSVLDFAGHRQHEDPGRCLT
ncbi:hypothetical protein [Devosia lacusdianchii]|uniref:hypothetical protein n=1 Tax=Devosia lacusdianchii TaxID=2917991 RepID=UPI001F06924B|nr:hypothetical protein [Devosia sp. JXJ CY 41]